MAENSFFKRINPFKAYNDNTKVKDLQDKLDRVMEEFETAQNYHTKFLDSDPSGGANLNGGDYSGIEQQVDAAAMQRIYCTETWVYNAVTTVAETIASLPIKLEKSRTVPKVTVNMVTGEKETIEEKVWIDASGEALSDIFQYPNKHTSKAEFYTLLVIDLLTAGEYFIHLDAAPGVDLTSIESDFTDEDPTSPFGRLRSVMAAKKPIAGMYRIPPALIKPVLSEDKRRVEGYALHTERGDFAFNAAEIIHVKLPNPLDACRGLSPLLAGFKPMLIDRFTTEHMIRFYKSGARLGGVIETDKTLNKEQLGRFQRSFDNNYTGRQNQHRTLVLPPGMSYKAIEQNPAETALLEFCRYNREAILATYKVPPVKMGLLDNSSYANAYAQLKTYYNDCIKPKLSFIQDGFNLKSCLMPDNRSYRMQFDLSQVEELKEDSKTTAETGKIMLESGLTVNEVRKRVWNASPILGGDQSPVVADMVNPLVSETSDPNAVDAPADTSADAPPEAAQEAQITDPTLSLNGAQVTALTAILQQVAQGFLPRQSGVQLVHVAFSVSLEQAERIMGPVGQTFMVDPNKPIEAPATPSIPEAPGAGAEGKELNPEMVAPTSIKPTSGSYSDRVTELVGQFVQAGIPMHLAVPKAIEQAKLEGFTEESQKLGTTENAALIPHGVAGGEPKKPCDCGKVPCDCDPGDKGGPGSGCTGPNCGRPHSDGSPPNPGNKPSEGGAVSSDNPHGYHTDRFGNGRIVPSFSKIDTKGTNIKINDKGQIKLSKPKDTKGALDQLEMMNKIFKEAENQWKEVKKDRNAPKGASTHAALVLNHVNRQLKRAMGNAASFFGGKKDASSVEDTLRKLLAEMIEKYGEPDYSEEDPILELPEGEDGEESKSLAEYIASALEKLDPSEPVTADLIDELVKIYHEAQAPQVEDKAAQVQRFSIKKEIADQEAKSFLSKTDPMVEKRLGQVQKFFKKFEQVLMNRFGANVKAYGLHKARDNEDIDDILDLDAYNELVADYVKEADAQLGNAYKYGFQNTLSKFTFSPPSNESKAFIQKFGGDSIRSVTDTTRDQIKALLSDSFEKNMAIGEISKAIKEKFVEMSEGRARNIARTEVLTAVSAGKQEKRQQWKERFPNDKLKKQWVSAADDHVRESHAAVDGEVVDEDENFSNGLAYPRDPSGPADEVINCRCDEITFMAEDQSAIAQTLNPENEEE